MTRPWPRTKPEAGDASLEGVEIIDEPGVEPVNGSDAVFAATAAAVWIAQGTPPAWPTGRPVTSV